LEQTFFGFKPEDRLRLHDTLFNLIWHGGGRWDFDTIYNMPIFLRKYWITRVQAIISPSDDNAEISTKKQQDAYQQKKNLGKSSR
jgi:hypothetical protein